MRAPVVAEARLANASRLPTPAGPWKRYACAGPSASAAAKQPLRLGLLRKGRERAHGSSRRARWARCAVENDDALREERRRAVAVPAGHDQAEARRPRARSDRARPPMAGLAPRESTLRTNVRSGSRPPVTTLFSSEHALDAEPAGDPLVGERRVEVAVADDVGATLERRPDHLGDMLGARPPQRAPLRPRRSSRGRAGRGRGSPRRARCRPARASRRPRRAPAAVSAGRPAARQLRGLAGAVEPFEGDEHQRVPRLPTNANTTCHWCARGRHRQEHGLSKSARTWSMRVIVSGATRLHRSRRRRPVARGDRYTFSTTATGSQERRCDLSSRATSERHRRPPASTSSSTSRRRPTSAPRSSGPTTTPR